jgi:hypothetical protein
VLHSRELCKPRPRYNAFRPEFLAAPRADDQIGFARDHLLSRHNTVFGSFLIPTIGEDVDPAGDLDKLRNSPNSGDQRIVPLLKEHPRPFG